MKQILGHSLITLMMATIVFVSLGDSLLVSSTAQRQLQASYITICSGDRPCQHFTSNDPSSKFMQSGEGKLNEGDGELLYRADSSQSFLNSVSEEDTPNSYEDDGRDQEEENAASHETFEQELNEAPKAVKVETEYTGMRIFLDYILFDDQRVVENPIRYYNNGLLELQRGETITFSFADCNAKCNDPPESIRSVYLVDGNADDNMIISGNIDDDLKAIFEQTDPDSFEFRVPNGVTGSNVSNKLVIETQQTDKISAFYIQQGVEVS